MCLVIFVKVREGKGREGKRGKREGKGKREEKGKGKKGKREGKGKRERNYKDSEGTLMRSRVYRYTRLHCTL